MIAFRPRQLRAARRFIGRAGSWLAAWLIVFAASAFALRDPVTLEVAVLRAIDLIDAAHDHRHDHAKAQASKTNALHDAHRDLGHDHRDCPLCAAPALASGAADLVIARAPNSGTVSRLSNRAVLHVQYEHHGSVQSRAPPLGLTHA